MNIYTVLLVSALYMGILFFTAWWVEKRSNQHQRSLINNPYIYSLSLAIFCTAWTFFGSVGRASTGGLSFLAIYLGPTITAPLWFFVLRKMVLISKHQRITSIADFISARFGKSGNLATLVTIIAVAGVIPYISIQLKAVTFGIDVLTAHRYAYFKEDVHFYFDASFWITCAMILFTVLFGTRKIDPNEKHEGLVAAIALESVVKLVAFCAVGIFVVFYLHQAPSDLFQKAASNPEINKLFSINASRVSTTTWNMMMILSAFAFLLLPRQFHIAVVENNNPKHIYTAMWMLPLYLLLINIFVFPIAIAGKIQFGASVLPDSYVLALPIAANANILSLLVFLGGLSAATSMVIVSSIAMSIMISNHLVVAPLLRRGWPGNDSNGSGLLLRIRRWSIIGVMLMAYLYLKTIGRGYDLVSVGLISFTAVAQFAPATFLGMFWKGATQRGAFWGMLVGFIIWAYCLPFTSMAESGIFDQSFIQNGPFGIEWLRPKSLFGLQGMDTISHAAWWSLLFNTMIFYGVSSFTRPSSLTLTQADLFINIHRYTAGKEYDPVKREAQMHELMSMMARFLGEKRLGELLAYYEALHQVRLKDQKTADADLINYLETHLSGAIGAASARLMTESISKEEKITLEEVMLVMEQTQEMLQYSKALEIKSAELEKATLQLTEANEQLKALDKLKADFITTVTHELRTPVTSIKSLAKIMLDYGQELPKEKQASYLAIIVSESDRISRLINQVLDIEKLQSDNHIKQPMVPVQLEEIIHLVMLGMEQIFKERGILCTYENKSASTLVLGHRDRLIQVVVNLVSNAVKFCNPNNGTIDISLQNKNNEVWITVSDNGQGIAPDAQAFIFEQFTQLNYPELGKPEGTGLGLFICRQIVTQHNGTIAVKSSLGKGASFIVRLPELILE
ncbi:MAG: hypothetical protein RIR11_4153 [Bacteroidota bacterium]|jgi:Na+/proline symporter/signal transduction histidine kinase